MAEMAAPIPRDFKPTEINPDQPDTWLPHMAVCDDIPSLYQALDENPKLTMAICFKPEISPEAITQALWLNEVCNIITAGLICDQEEWCNWQTSIHENLQSTVGPDKAPDGCLDDLFSFMSRCREPKAASKLDNVAVFTSGTERPSDAASFHKDIGCYTLLHSFSVAGTWHLPPDTNVYGALWSDTRATPVGATTLHRGSTYPDGREVSLGYRHTHTTPLVSGRRATFVLNSRPSGGIWG